MRLEVILIYIVVSWALFGIFISALLSNLLKEYKINFFKPKSIGKSPIYELVENSYTKSYYTIVKHELKWDYENYNFLQIFLFFPILFKYYRYVKNDKTYGFFFKRRG